ncbi:ester cyclase [Caballeronia sp. GACF4]|jgi:predicted ester cyclase|uniref:ester cyclase n=1 Tax=Caballeronia sp. GACF4 TaxID=2921763 RepID=UPI00202873F1|nr:ester cyclase [Caballeronia sp. GACF4]
MLSLIYRDYIACLNGKDWTKLGQFVHDEVSYNDVPGTLAGYIGMLERDYEQIPDLHFNIELLVEDAQTVAARLLFDCSPKGTFLGVPVHGRRVCFRENVFYRFRDERIERVWSVIDKAAIEAQVL